MSYHGYRQPNLGGRREPFVIAQQGDSANPGSRGKRNLLLDSDGNLFLTSSRAHKVYKFLTDYLGN